MLIFHTFLAYHLQINADPDRDPAYHFDADPDADPAYHCDPDLAFQFYPDPQHCSKYLVI